MIVGAALRGRPNRTQYGRSGAATECRPYNHPTLKFEARGELHLALAEQRAVCAGDVEERIGSSAVECQRRSGKVVNRSVNDCHLRAVEDVETFRQHFDLHLLTQTEASRESRVNVPNV